MAFAVHQVQHETAQLSRYPDLRVKLWPMPDDDNRRETAEILASDQWAVFIASLPDGTPAGFVEIHLREYAEGAESSPVGYLEGLYVIAGFRHRGIARALVQAAENWAQSRGCVEIASDTEIENAASIEMHRRLGYEEVERQVCFLKPLPR